MSNKLAEETDLLVPVLVSDKPTTTFSGKFVYSHVPAKGFARTAVVLRGGGAAEGERGFG